MNRLIALVATLLIGLLALTPPAQAKSYTFTTLNDPAVAQGTFAYGINNSGQVTGYYADATGGVNGCVDSQVSEEVAIDIEPSFNPNIVDLKLKKVPIPVAILSAPGFDAPKSIDLDSLTFGHSGNEKSLVFCSPMSVDVNGDKVRDLICFFHTVKAGFQCGDTRGILKGKTKDGKPIEGSDAVKIVPCE